MVLYWSLKIINRALEEFKDIKFEIEHMPFQLNPDLCQRME
jgi:predicted DsbA family dithiol-disulfide isomerase